MIWVDNLASLPMSRPQLNIKFDAEDEEKFLDLVKARAKQERISLKELVIDALKTRLSGPRPFTQPNPVEDTREFNRIEDDLRRRVAEIQLGLMSEIRKDREQIAILAAAIAQLEARLDKLDPPTVEASQDTQASQDKWENNAVEFLDTVNWSGWWVMGEINDLRFTATAEDLNKWEWFLKQMEKRGLITIFESSKQYNNRGDSKLKRQYFKVKLNAEKPD